MIPPSNPPPPTPASLDAYIWEEYARNPWRISFDRPDRRSMDCRCRPKCKRKSMLKLRAGKNYGWNCREGDSQDFRLPVKTIPGLLDPVFEYLHCSPCNTPGVGNSITGGLYTGEVTLAMQHSKVIISVRIMFLTHAWLIKQSSGNSRAPGSFAG